MRLFDRRFTTLLGAYTSSNLADGIVLLAFPLTAVALGAEAWQTAVVVACSKTPWLLFGLSVGVLADRLDRIRMAQVASLARMVVLAGLAALLVSGSDSLALLVVAALLAGTCEVVYDIASQTLTPAVVHRTNLVRANGYVSSAQNATNEFVGPPLGGLLIGFAGWLPYAFSATAYAAVALLMTRLRRSRITPRSPGTPEAGPTPHGLQDRSLRAGLLFVGRNVFLRRLGGYLFGVYVVFGVWIGLFVFFITTDSQLQLSPAELGLLMAVSACGGVAGGQAANLLINRLGEYAVLALGAFGWALYMLGPLVSGSFWVVASLMVLGSMLGTAMGVSSFALRLMTTPAPLLGRVSSVFRLVTWGSLPVGSLAGGALSAVVGTAETMWAATGAMSLLTGLALLAFRGQGRPDPAVI